MEFLKALLIGVIVALPAGPILVMAVQRTLCHGRRAGVMVGLGAALGDAVFAAVGLLTLTVVERFVQDHEAWIMLVGGVLIGLIGVSILRRRISVELPPDRQNLSLWACCLQALGSTLSNPGALALILGLLALFGVDAQASRVPALLPAAVGLGEWMYWLLAVYLLGRFIRLDTRSLRRLSRVAGILVCCFALVLTVRGLVMIIGS